MTMKGKYTGAMVDEFRVIAAAHSIMDCLKLMPSDGEIMEFPKLKLARDHANNALIDLHHSGVDLNSDAEEAARPKASRRPRE